ncbi:MAG: hypothetical protein HC767_04955 [Akkermansiaceae bacterium]|nr:hypothetical protein [Akkermansiaceae bacterium]
MSAAMMHEQKLSFTDAPTEEETRLAELPHFNTFTAVQLISYAYDEALDLDALLSECQRQEVLQQACPGVPASVIQSMMGSLRQLQEALLQEDTPQPKHHAADQADTHPDGMMAAGPPDMPALYAWCAWQHKCCQERLGRCTLAH